MKPPINLYLATSTGCNVRCKTCPAGRKESEPGGIMSLDMLRRILDKCDKESRIIGVQLYHYNEPTLIPHMSEMVKECHSRNLPVFLSTNGVVWKNIPSILNEEPEMFLVSVSGFTQSVYERSHKDGDIQVVMENMKKMAILRKPKTVLQLSWHRYRYNTHEESLMKDFAESLGFQFVPYATSLIPHDRAIKVWQTGIDDSSAEDILIPVKDAQKLCYDRKKWMCLLQEQIVAINGKGDILLCSNFADEKYLRDNLFNTTIPEFLAKRKQDHVCKSCKSVGGHIYAMQFYTRSRLSPLIYLEQLYRKLKLQGRFPALSAWATRSLYKISRPQEKSSL